jgi:hypothetical protein
VRADEAGGAGDEDFGRWRRDGGSLKDNRIRTTVRPSLGRIGEHVVVPQRLAVTAVHTGQ